MKNFTVLLTLLSFLSCSENTEAVPVELIENNTEVSEYWINFGSDVYGKVFRESVSSDSIKLSSKLFLDKLAFETSIGVNSEVNYNEQRIGDLSFQVVEYVESEYIANRKWYNVMFRTNPDIGVVYTKDIGVYLRYSSHSYEYLLLKSSRIDGSIEDTFYNDVYRDVSRFKNIPGYNIN